MLEKIRLVEPNTYGNYDVDDDNNKHYTLTINMDAPFSELTDKKHIDKIIDGIELLININEFEELDKIYKEELEYFKNIKEDTLKNVEYIYFDIDDIDITIKYLEENPELKNKKIILNSEFDEKSIYNIKNIFNENTNNIHLMIPGNTRQVSFEEAINTLSKINEMVKEIKNRNLSPFESLLATYDIVRNHEYISEDKNERSSVSRDLTDVILGEKRVCVGFAQIMDIVLNKLGIKSSLYSIEAFDEKEAGHIRNMVNIIDPKYKIDGIYFCDATWDCKKKKDDTSYLTSYKFFAKTYEQMKNYDMIEGLKDVKLSFIDKDMISLLKKADTKNLDISLIGQIAKTIRTLTYFDYGDNTFNISDFITGKQIDYNLLDAKIKKCTARFHRRLDARKILEAISVVRSEEDLTMKDYNKIIKKSEIKFILTPEERLIMTLFTDVDMSNNEAILNHLLKEEEKKLIKKI